MVALVQVIGWLCAFAGVTAFWVVVRRVTLHDAAPVWLLMLVAPVLTVAGAFLVLNPIGTD